MRKHPRPARTTSLQTQAARRFFSPASRKDLTGRLSKAGTGRRVERRDTPPRAGKTLFAVVCQDAGPCRADCGAGRWRSHLLSPGPHVLPATARKLHQVKTPALEKTPISLPPSPPAGLKPCFHHGITVSARFSGCPERTDACALPVWCGDTTTCPQTTNLQMAYHLTPGVITLINIINNNHRYHCY